MKITTIILLAIAMPLFSLGQEVNVNQLEKKDNLFYLKASSKPYTGKAITYSNENIKENSIEYVSGLPNGILTGYYPNGSKQVEGKIIGVSKIGKWTAWYQNKNKIREGEYLNNKEEGLFTWWFENGNINKKGNYKNGVALGTWEWYYENGKLKQIGEIDGETNLGLWKDFYENGNQKNEGEFKNGQMIGTWQTWDAFGTKTNKTYDNGVLKSDKTDTDTYIEKMQNYLGEKDFKNALINIQKAIETVNNKTESTPEYMNLVVMYSKVYSLFNHLDEAEKVILTSTGIPENQVETIISSISPETHSELKKIAISINNSSISKSKIAPHIALSLIYNIVGDTINLRKEQQLMMERSNTSDWVLSNSMALYGIRASKETNYGIINDILNEVKVDGKNYKNQLQLTYYLSLYGKFDEAEIITEKYLKENPNDIDFLRMKLNIEMSKGNTNSMKEIKLKMLKINPKAFDE